MTALRAKPAALDSFHDGEGIMNAFLAACVAVLVIAGAAWKALETQQIDSAHRFTTQSVRLD
jgi:hypothetical protein